MSLGLFIGRFQPVHLGHISAIEQLLELNLDRIVIGIGSSNAPLSQINPFSIIQREQLLRQSLDLHFSNHIIEIVSLPDYEYDVEWTDHIMQDIGPTHIMSGNAWTRDCFDNRGVEIIVPEFAHQISGTQIRDAWRDGTIGEVGNFLDIHVVEFLMKR